LALLEVALPPKSRNGPSNISSIIEGKMHL
jgi:hypothetical protein